MIQRSNNKAWMMKVSDSKNPLGGKQQTNLFNSNQIINASKNSTYMGLNSRQPNGN